MHEQQADKPDEYQHVHDPAEAALAKDASLKKDVYQERLEKGQDLSAEYRAEGVRERTGDPAAIRNVCGPETRFSQKPGVEFVENPQDEKGQRRVKKDFKNHGATCLQMPNSETIEGSGSPLTQA